MRSWSLVRLPAERGDNENSMVCKEQHITAAEDENGWVLINLRDDSEDGCSDDAEIREILSDYVVITVGELTPTECGKREEVIKKKEKRFLKVPTRRLCVPYPLLAMPRYNHKIGKIRKHGPSTKRPQPYTRTRLDRLQDTLKSTLSTQPVDCCPAVLDTLHKPQGGSARGGIDLKDYNNSNFRFDPPQRKVLVEKRLPDYRMTLDDLYFASTCCMIKVLLALGRGHRAVLQRKIFVTAKNRACPPAALLGSRDRCKSFALVAGDLSFPRLDVETPERVDICEEVANTMSVRSMADAGYRSKASREATNIYVDVLKALASKRSYSTTLGLKELSVGNNIYKDLLAALKSVKEGTKATRMEASSAVISVSEDVIKMVKVIEKDLNRVCRLNGSTGEYGVYEDVLKALGFPEKEKESSRICLRASPGTTNIYERVKKALNNAESDHIIAEVSFFPRVVKAYEDSTSMPRVPDGGHTSFSSVDLQHQRAAVFSPLLLFPTPLCIEWKANDRRTKASYLLSVAHLLNKATALCEDKIVATISRLPQLLPTVPEIPGPTILLWLLGCHILSVLRSYPTFWPSTTRTHIRQQRSDSFQNGCGSPPVVRVLRSPMIHSEPLFVRQMTKRGLAAQKASQRDMKRRRLENIHSVKCPLGRKCVKGNRKNALVNGKFHYMPGKRGC